MIKATLTTFAAAALSLSISGCVLYTGNGDDDDDDCLDWGGGGGGDRGAALELRNPWTGQCQLIGGGGGGGGTGTCGDYGGGETEPGERAPEQDTSDWATCYDSCNGLDEASCTAASGCRAAYISDCPEGLDCGNTTYTFRECWATAPSGPIQGGGCESLDALECSRHDDCVARHHPQQPEGGGRGAPEPDPALVQALGNFESCAAEVGGPVGCYEGGACGEGYVCNAAEVCEPPPGCATDGGPTPGGDEAPQEPIDCTLCYGQCVPDFDVDPGTCYGEITCRAVEPGCPPNTVPGRRNGCYTGACILVENCEMPPTCAGLAEPACVDRADCSALYEGVGCSCDADGCGCTDWLYSSCQDA